MSALATVGDELALVRILESLPPDDRRVVESAIGRSKDDRQVADQLHDLEDTVGGLRDEIRDLRKKLGVR